MAGSERYEIRWRLAHDNLMGFDTATKAFERVVSAETGGAVRLVKVSPSANEDSSQVPAKVAAGVYEMGQAYSFTLVPLEPRLQLFDLPFLFDGDRQLFRVFEDEIAEELASGLVPHGLRALGFTYSGGFQVVASTDRKIRGPRDLTGMRIGSYGNPVENAWLRRLGAVPVEFGDQLHRSGLRLKKDWRLDGIFRTYHVLRKHGDVRVFPHVTQLFAVPRVSVIVINEAFYRRLPADYQRAVRKAARIASALERKTALRQNEDARRTLLRETGILIPTSRERAEFKTASVPIYGRFAAVLDDKTLLKVRRTAGP